MLSFHGVQAAFTNALGVFFPDQSFFWNYDLSLAVLDQLAFDQR